LLEDLNPSAIHCIRYQASGVGRFTCRLIPVT
jgi:hypothetical protein